MVPVLPCTNNNIMILSTVFMIQFAEVVYNYVEGDPNAQVCLQGTGEIAQPARVTISSVSGGTATSKLVCEKKHGYVCVDAAVGNDYVALNVPIAFNGAGIICVPVNVTDDPFLEDEEYFPLAIDSVMPLPGVVTGSQNSTIFFIRDNDRNFLNTLFIAIELHYGIFFSCICGI